MKNKFACGLALASLFLCHTLATSPSLLEKGAQKVGHSNTKYFSEAGPSQILGHYDSRYYPGHIASQDTQSESLHHLIVSYHAYFEAFNISTWLAHGSLLGWFWNGKVFPWDSDLDTQVWADDLYMLAALNMTQYDYHTIIEPAARKTIQSQDWRTPKPPQPVEFRRRYLLDVNPYHVDRSLDWLNVIDARWIDTETGLFIDITGLSDADDSQAGRSGNGAERGSGNGVGGGKGSWTCKNRHRYPKAQLSRDKMVPTVFEGRRALVPKAYREILTAEYGRLALVNKKFNKHTFVYEIGEWVRDKQDTVG